MPKKDAKKALEPQISETGLVVVEGQELENVTGGTGSVIDETPLLAEAKAAKTKAAETKAEIKPKPWNGVYEPLAGSPPKANPFQRFLNHPK